MKILINCPGSWTHGLDSPERGEGRYAQNLVRCLADAGHQVFATSGGIPTWGETASVQNVTLIAEQNIIDNEPYDIFIDPCFGLLPKVNAKYIFSVKWEIDRDIYKKNLPDNFFFLFPFQELIPYFINPMNINAHKCFFLPSSYGKHFSLPRWDKENILSSSRHKTGDIPEFLFPALRVLSNLDKIFCLNCQPSNTNENIVQGLSIKRYASLPYFQVRNIIQECKYNISIPFRNCLLDSTFLGVPSLITDTNVKNKLSSAFYATIEIAKKHNVLIPGDFTSEDIRTILLKLDSDKNLYKKYVQDLQSLFESHLDKNVINYFSQIIDQIHSQDVFSYPDGYLYNSNVSGEIRNGLRVGHWTRKHYNGLLAEEGNFLNGVPHGIWKEYFPNELQRIEASYKNGQLDGIYKRWFKSGRPYTVGCYSRDLQHGEWIEYHTTGSIHIIGSYVEDKRDGLWTWHNDEGKPMDQRVYKNGIEISYKSLV